jgi:hypothetical protein
LTTGQVGAKRISAVEVGVGIGVVVKEGVGVGIGIKGTGRAVPNVRTGTGNGVKVGVGVSGIVSPVGVGIAVKVGAAVGLGSLAVRAGKVGRRCAQPGAVKKHPAQTILMMINPVRASSQLSGLCSAIG